MRAKHIRTALTLLLSSGAVAQAQPLMQASCSWTEVIAGTSTPVSNPNGILDPGEGALITLNLMATMNGSDAIGQTITYTPPPPPGTGTVSGIGYFTYDLRGTGGDASGTWSNRSANAIFDHIELGTFDANGAQVIGFGGVQFTIGGATVIATNPINSAWRGVWNPSSFSPRVVHFAFAASRIVPTNQQNTFAAYLGINPSTGEPRYQGVYVPTSFGPGIDIPFGTDFHPHSGGGGDPITLAGFCYANCDHSTTPPILNVNDFQCFLNAFAAGQGFANCDNSTANPVLNVNDFQCFLNKFATGCV